MTQDESGILLFPHTTLSDRDFRHLSLLLPGFSLLQVVRPPSVPEWARVLPLPVIEDELWIERIELYLGGYRDFAQVHGGGSLVGGLNRCWPEADLESRFGIQHGLKGKPPLELELKDRLVLEAAVFLEMARDLDEKEMEMENGLFEAAGLEEKFREILGISDEREVEGPMEILTPPLAPDRNYLSFMLAKRIACWFRLLSLKAPEARPVLLALIPEAVDVLLDPFRIEGYRTGSPLQPLRMELGCIPSLEGLSREAFMALAGELEASGTRESWWKALGDLLKDPRDPSLLKNAETGLKSLGSSIEDFLKRTGCEGAGITGLNLVCSDGWSGGDLWKNADKNGYEALGENLRAEGPCPLLLFMS